MECQITIVLSLILIMVLSHRRLVYSDLEAIAPLEVEKMPYSLQAITISVCSSSAHTLANVFASLGYVLWS